MASDLLAAPERLGELLAVVEEGERAVEDPLALREEVLVDLESSADVFCVDENSTVQCSAEKCTSG